VRAGELLLRKGRVLSGDDIVSLENAGIAEIIVARLEAGDIGEDEAAARIARACAGDHVRVGAAFTGRVNLYAENDGVACVVADGIAKINSVDESVTLATVPPFARVVARQMLATVKIIPFAAPSQSVGTVERLAAHVPLIAVAPFQARRAALILTMLPNISQQLIDKSARAVDTRLHALGSELVMERTVSHEESALTAAIAEALSAGANPILILGASAITDRRDIIPAAIERAGGTAERFGMPVDPGNLLLLGRVNGTSVIGLPSCARSPKRNGFDFVLERTLAGVSLTATDFAAMGVGGLLGEIPTRPQPRDVRPQDVPRAPSVTAVVVAAGLATRMGRNKLTAAVRGKPLLRHAVDAALDSHALEVIVVTGNDAAGVKAVLDGVPVRFVHNADFGQGLSTSLKAGLRAVPDDSDGAIILLGDMPDISADLLDRLIAAFNPGEGRAICVASHAGKRGNPVLWSRHFFPEILALEGDVGAKHIMTTNDETVCEVEAGSDAPLVDIDTPEALAEYGRRR
jgi:molybdenum cofactor cytidylyltransferase